MTRVNHRLMPSSFQSPPPERLNWHDDCRLLSLLQELVSQGEDDGGGCKEIGPSTSCIEPYNCLPFAASRNRSGVCS